MEDQKQKRPGNNARRFIADQANAGLVLLGGKPRGPLLDFLQFGFAPGAVDVIAEFIQLFKHALRSAP